MDDYLRRNYGASASHDQDATKDKHKHKRKRDKSDKQHSNFRVLDDDEQFAVAAGTGNLNDVGRDMAYAAQIKRAEDLLRTQEREAAKPAPLVRPRAVESRWISIDERGPAQCEDPSPPRRGARHDSPDPSPPRRGARHDSPDPSPPRGGGARHDSPDPSPPRRGARHDSPDPSPPRRGARHDSPDPSPPRRGGARHDSPDRPTQQLPARREASDLPHARAPAEPPVVGAASRTFSAPGLHTNVQSEVAALQAERASQLRATDATVLGAGAETVYRGKDGRELDFATEVLKAGAGAGEKPSNAPAWGGGLRQKQADEEKRAHLRAESGKAFARYADDKELDDHMRHTARWGDPLADRVGRDKAATAAAALRPKYGKAGPPNRFGIQPGHRWDGVDRSNGFEKAFFSMQSNASLRKQAAHAWSTEDM